MGGGRGGGVVAGGYCVNIDGDGVVAGGAGNRDLKCGECIEFDTF